MNLREASKVFTPKGSNFIIPLKVLKTKLVESKSSEKQNQLAIVQDSEGIRKIFYNCKYPLIELEEGVSYLVDFTGISENKYKEIVFINKANIINPLTINQCTDFNSAKKQLIPKLSLTVQKVFNPSTDLEENEQLVDYSLDMIVKLKDQKNTYFLRVWANQQIEKQNFYPGAKVLLCNFDIFKSDSSFNLAINNFSQIVFET